MNVKPPWTQNPNVAGRATSLVAALAATATGARPFPDVMPFVGTVLVGLAAVLGSCSSQAEDEPTACSDSAALELYERRIEPLLKESQPKSCNQCHLSGIDLSMFIREDPCETMACLTELGLADLSSPEDSRVLSFIERAEPQSKLITQKVIDAEYDGFREWLEFNASCFDDICEGVRCSTKPTTAQSCGVVGEAFEVDDEGLDDCSDKGLEALFRDRIYDSRGRCSPCHFDNVDPIVIDGELAPQWIKTEGSCNQASLATFRTVVRSGYINTRHPLKSLLLRKPLAEDEGGVAHGGHDKITVMNDPSYTEFVLFLEHYAACQTSKSE